MNPRARSAARLIALVGAALMFVPCGALAAAGSAPAGNAAAMAAEIKSWLEPAEPIQIVGPIYLVGTRGLGCVAIAVRVRSIAHIGPANTRFICQRSAR
jgi:hypothetical protein